MKGRFLTVNGFPVALAAEHRAIVGEDLDIESVKKKFSIADLSGLPSTFAPLFWSTSCTFDN
jgi:hypothetical protein